MIFGTVHWSILLSLGWLRAMCRGILHVICVSLPHEVLCSMPDRIVRTAYYIEYDAASPVEKSHKAGKTNLVLTPGQLAAFRADLLHGMFSE